MIQRACGVLLPVASLPSKYGIGCFDRAAYDFIDDLADAGQSYWQILPLGPTSYGDSPYQSFSTFAGNPYFISLDALISQGLLTEEECEKADFGEDPEEIDYGLLYQERFVLLKKAMKRFKEKVLEAQAEKERREALLKAAAAKDADKTEKEETNKEETDQEVSPAKAAEAQKEAGSEKAASTEKPGEEEIDFLKEQEAFLAFRRENASWLEDYALYMAIKEERFEGKAWSEWAEDIRRRWDYSMDYYRKELTEETEFYCFLQYLFMVQWKQLKAYANEKGIRIVGDIPIYVAMDSADAWASPWLFKVDESCQPVTVAGCPPDGFSATGQLWGNPIYNWEAHRQSGYDWWIRRLEHCFRLYDVVRIDHFRGFDEYYAIPFGDRTAEKGWWEKGPGMDFFNTVKARLGEKAIIAEDLGFMTDTVRRLVADSGFPNMRVLEFAFDERDTGNHNDYLPHNYVKNCVVYTGTHDNETLMGWLKHMDDPTKDKIREYYFLNKDAGDEAIRREMVRSAVGSVADLCIIPMQDYLGLDNRARINYPSTLGGNWEWRMKAGAFTKKLREEMHHLARVYSRI